MSGPIDTAGYCLAIATETIELLVRVHRACSKPPPEYPASLQSQLLGVQRMFEKINGWLVTNPETQILDFQKHIDSCQGIIQELNSNMDQYESEYPHGNEQKWNDVAKPSVLKLHNLIEFLQPFHSLTSNEAIRDHVVSAFDADNRSILTGDTLRGYQEVDAFKKEKDQEEKDGDKKIRNTGTSRGLGKPTMKRAQKWGKPNSGGRFSKIGYRVINFLAPPKLSLHDATEKGSKFAVKRVLYNNPEIDAKDCAKRTALYTAVGCGDVEIAHILLKWGSDVNVQDTTGMTPLMLAASYRGKEWNEIAQVLLDYGADVNKADNDAVTATHRLARHKDQNENDMLEIMLKAGADIDIPGKKHDRLLHYAVSNGDLSLISKLLDAGANPNVTNFDSKTPFHLAVEKGFCNIVERLIIAGANVNAFGLRWETPLMAAAGKGNIPILRTLIKSGANLEASNTEKHRAIHNAVFYDRLEALDELIKAGAEVDARGRFGETALTLAAQNGHYNCAVRLLAVGASTKLEQGSPRGIVVGNALACARHWEKCGELTRLLEQLEADESKKVTTADYLHCVPEPSNFPPIKDWMNKFIVKVYEQEKNKSDPSADRSNTTGIR